VRRAGPNAGSPRGPRSCCLCVSGPNSSTVEVAASPSPVCLWPKLAFQLHQAPDPGSISADVGLDVGGRLVDGGQVDAEQLRAPLQRRRDRPAQIRVVPSPHQSSLSNTCSRSNRECYLAPTDGPLGRIGAQSTGGHGWLRPSRSRLVGRSSPSGLRRLLWWLLACWLWVTTPPLGPRRREYLPAGGLEGEVEGVPASCELDPSQAVPPASAGGTDGVKGLIRTGERR
jgi:hypothetical protein